MPEGLEPELSNGLAHVGRCPRGVEPRGGLAVRRPDGRREGQRLRPRGEDPVERLGEQQRLIVHPIKDRLGLHLLGKPRLDLLGRAGQIRTADYTRRELIPQQGAMLRPFEVEGDLAVVDTVIVVDTARTDRVHELVHQIAHTLHLDDEGQSGPVGLSPASDEVLARLVEHHLRSPFG